MIKTYEHTIGTMAGDKVSLVENNIALLAMPATIAFKNIYFSYNEKKVFNDLNCSFSKGDFIGIAGISGRGKTTLINLLLGFEEPLEGRIFFDNAATDLVARQQYRGHIAYVKQQPFLIHDTIATNITLSDSAIDEGQLASAITIAGLNEMLLQYPEGIHKVITENGKNISGGQRQRIVIARALYKNAGIIILDEPFNELDHAAENKLLTHFKQEAAKGKIIILITHNKSSLSFCNKIISLDEQ
jgi:ABC-type multidrug transport system fused ATPase/permease subunit